LGFQLKYINYDIYKGMNEEDKPLVWLHGAVKTPPFSQEARIEAEQHRIISLISAKND
jgi:hypothetical protein